MKTHSEQKKLTNGGWMILYLFTIILCAVVTTGLTRAKLRSSASGSTNAEVAAFIADTYTHVPLELDLDKRLQVEYRFVMKNNDGGKASEVALKYDLVIELPEPLPEGVTMEIWTEESGTPKTQMSSTVSEDKKTYTFANAGSFEAGAKPQEQHFILYFKAVWTVPDTELKGIKVYANIEQTD